MEQGIVSRTGVLPVTALAFLSDDVLLCGSGGTLTVYDVSGVQRRIVYSCRIFEYSRIHGIIVRDGGTSVVVFGSKEWAVVDVAEDLVKVQNRHVERDWIKAAHWVRDGEDGEWLVALALAHNRVCLRRASDGRLWMEAQSAERCILYAAAFYGDSLDSLVVASGTVFNEVLLWRVSAGECPALLRMRGHDGVIFGLGFSADGRRLASVSDDRTVHLWDIGGRDSGEVEQAVAPAEVLFGHQARVWSCLVLRDYLVSASEDGTCRVWDGATLETVDVWTQAAKNAWCVAASPKQLQVASGGGDGSVNVWSLEGVRERRVEDRRDLDTVELPVQAEYLPAGREPSAAEHIRGFGLLAGTDAPVLVTTNSGCALSCRAGKWAKVASPSMLRGYSMTAGLASGALVAVGMRDGSAMLVSPQGWVVGPVKLHTAAIRTLYFQDAQANGDPDVYDLVTVDSDGCVLWTQARCTAAKVEWRAKACLAIPGRSQFASAAISERLGWAVIGTVNGGLCLYELPVLNGTELANLPGQEHTAAVDGLGCLEASMYWAQVHGKVPLSAVVFEPATDLPGSYPHDCMLLTGGRDGLMQRFRIRRAAGPTGAPGTDASRAGPVHLVSDQRISIERVASDKLTDGWVERLTYHPATGTVYAVTFFRKRLAVVDVANGGREVLSVVSAGGGKQWQVVFAGQSVRVGLMRKTQLMTYQATLNLTASQAVAVGGSARDIRSLCIQRVAVPGRDDIVVLASGGEDGVVYVHEYLDGKLHLLVKARRHTSAIKCMAFLGSGTANYQSPLYLVSAGAGCEMRCWRLSLGNSSGVPATLSEWAVAPPMSGSDADLRIMDICVCQADDSPLVAAGYSDGSVCLWRLSIEHCRFDCVASDATTVGRCVFSVASVALPDRVLVMSGASDGRIVYWDISTMGSDEQVRDLSPFVVFAQEGVHLSGVNCLDSRPDADGCIAVVSGGDDGSVAWSRLRVTDTAVELVELTRQRSAHGSGVQQVLFISNQVCSVATDQRLAVWSRDLELQCMAYTQVADPSAMGMLPAARAGHHLAVVAGMGLEALEM